MSTKSSSEENSYSEELFQQIGISGIDDPINQVLVYSNDNADGAHKDVLIRKPFIEPYKDGFRMPIVTLNRHHITYSKEGAKTKQFAFIIRHNPPIVKPDGSEAKYEYPKGVERIPFFPETIKNAYEQGHELPVLIITEGEKKAFVAAMHGAPIVGVGGIFNLAEKSTGKPHPEILQVIEKCKVKRLIFLLDGDADSISEKALEKGKSLSAKPTNFMRAIENFRSLFSDYDVDLFVFITASENILQKTTQIQD